MIPARIIFSLVSFPLISTSFAMAEEVDPWESVSRSLDAGEEVVILPLPSEIELEEQPPPQQPELHFSGASSEGGGNIAQATLAFPSISVGEQGVVSPFFALKGQSDGTDQGQIMAIEGGVSLSIGERAHLQLSIERMVYPLPLTAFQMNAVFRAF
jgi:hypothetical protein